MKLQDYINELTKLLDEHGNLEIVYASDDEGNYYDVVHYNPTGVQYNFKEHEIYTPEDEDEKITVNAICIN